MSLILLQDSQDDLARIHNYLLLSPDNPTLIRDQLMPSVFKSSGPFRADLGHGLMNNIMVRIQTCVTVSLHQNLDLILLSFNIPLTISALTDGFHFSPPRTLKSYPFYTVLVF
jgi:hypothetical protein